MYRVDRAFGREAGARVSIEIGPQRYQTRPKHVPDVAWSELVMMKGSKDDAGQAGSVPFAHLARSTGSDKAF